LAASAVEQCYSYGGGFVYPQENTAKGHNLQWTKALISKPAPPFEATAVINGSFKTIKLADFKGKYVVFFFYPLDFTFVCPTEPWLSTTGWTSLKRSILKSLHALWIRITRI